MKEDDYPSSDDPSWETTVTPIEAFLACQRTLSEIREWAKKTKHPVKQVEHAIAWLEMRGRMRKIPSTPTSVQLYIRDTPPPPPSIRYAMPTVQIVQMKDVREGSYRHLCTDSVDVPEIVLREHRKEIDENLFVRNMGEPPTTEEVEMESEPKVQHQEEWIAGDAAGVRFSRDPSLFSHLARNKGVRRKKVEGVWVYSAKELAEYFTKLGGVGEGRRSKKPRGEKASPLASKPAVVPKRKKDLPPVLNTVTADQMKSAVAAVAAASDPPPASKKLNLKLLIQCWQEQVLTAEDVMLRLERFVTIGK